MFPTVDEVAARARTVNLKPGRALLALVLAPFILVGFVVGLLWGAVVYCWAACAEGFRAGRRVSDARAA